MKQTVVEEKKRNYGGRNLMILGIVSAVIAVATTSVSLAIYHNSGDIYLDRSRPGYLPDEDEIIEEEEKKPESFEFEKTGVIDTTAIEEYIKHFDLEVEALNAYEKPFDGKVLSDEHLGISEQQVTE